MKLDRLVSPATCSRCPALIGASELVGRDDATLEVVCLRCAGRELERVVGVPCVCRGPLPARPIMCSAHGCYAGFCSPACVRAHARWHSVRATTGNEDHRLHAARAVAEELEDGYSVDGSTINGRALIEAFQGARALVATRVR